MASTYSTNLGLEKQGDGENANTWGLRLNQNVIDLVDQAVTGYSVITLTSGVQTSLTISDGQLSSGRSSSIEFVGFIDADTTVVVPALEKTYFVFNSITGSGNIYLKNSGGSTLTTVTSVGKGMYVATDGTNIRTISEVDDGPILANASAISVLDSTTYKNNVENTVSAGTFTFLEDVVLSFNVSTSSNPFVTKMFHDGFAQYIDCNTAIVIKDSTRTSTTNRFSFDVSSGSFTAVGDITAFSDERLKSNIKTLDGSKVFDMRGVSFTKDKKESSGVIAQELEKVAPELVNSAGEYKAVAYGNIVGYLIEAVKQLKKEIEELKENK
jgi:hypothetical protein